ncbi:carbohydrate ABC transporter substrate-binding protein, CUT1 family (TC 3.A.1.1.-) [Alkalibacterium putridalgicola]|uniref:Maltodextrin-binding protein n=1 Tax=Alkalibacterium putridalgicola TaxID=426703 RepID=A0A1H7UES1_9LACT|nr:extracellular solute-binding protein [Alkalibacterium putridalgicola]GEK89586.1 maltose ABC transporter substrate-binding protein [Alkalibacterium putridalgicola]SEL95296.1 carbohydrate ABC transporter substrate-binding protein, CUT1 family (TC 3.A.1.1.-) [Alkalibacterium putridalgicola]
MIDKKLWYKGMLLLSTAGVLAACGTGDNTDSEDTSGDTTEETSEDTTTEGETASQDTPEKPESLHIWVNDEEAQLNAYEEITSNFTEEHGIEVEITPYSMLEQTEGMSLDAPSGQGPDLFFQPHDRMGDIHLQGLAAELELTDDQMERLGEYNEDAVTAFSYEGAQYGIPAVVETYGLFINTDLVDEVPETMEELTQTAAELTEGEQYGFMMNAADLYFTYPFITADGGYIFAQNEDGSYDTSDIGLNTPEAVSAVERIQGWFEDGLMPQGTDLEVANSLFMDGQVGMIINGPWAIPDYQEALGDSLMVAELPTQDGEPLNSFSGNKGWLVNYYSEDQHWATELALYMTNAESSETYYEVAGELPAHTAVEIEDELMAPIFAQTQNAHPMPNIPEMQQVWEPMNDALTFIQQGDDVQEVLDEAVSTIESEISLMGQ